MSRAGLGVRAVRWQPNPVIPGLIRSHPVHPINSIWSVQFTHPGIEHFQDFESCATVGGGDTNSRNWHRTHPLPFIAPRNPPLQWRHPIERAKAPPKFRCKE